MDKIIEELNEKINQLLQENELISEEIEELKNQYYETNESINSPAIQEKRPELIQKLYDTYRKILYNKMCIYRYCERKQFIEIKGKDVPEEYKDIKFTNDNYKKVTIPSPSLSTKLSKIGPLRGLFNNKLFSLQASLQNRNSELESKMQESHDFVLALQSVNDQLNEQISFFISTKYEELGNITPEQFFYFLRNYLKEVQIDYQEFNISPESENDLRDLKAAYIDALLSELEVYITPDMTKEQIRSLADIKLYGNKAILTNHMNIFLGEFIGYQIEKLKLEKENEQLGSDKKYKLESSLDSLSYFDAVDSPLQIEKDSLQVSKGVR